MTSTAATRKELDHRFGDGLSVSLLWDPETDRAVVSVYDTRADDLFEIEVRSDERALDVFRHPYAYAAYRDAELLPRSLTAA